MRILVIEDNDIKYGLIVEFLGDSFPLATYQRAGSYRSAIRTLVSERFNLVILDMSLPVSDINQSFVDTDFMTFGGELVLRESRRKRVGATFAVLTQYNTFIRDKMEVSFEELRTELMESYPDSLRGCVKLDNSSVNWRNELSQIITNENPNC